MKCATSEKYKLPSVAPTATMAASTSADSLTVRIIVAEDLLKRDITRNDHNPTDPASATRARIDVNICTCSMLTGVTVLLRPTASIV